uniref:Uncharacterized protein MANES_16G114300 n=1 Tax=Rhizophora mucronata TaxID=61149 RepID=A0A2P2PID3_RHIMU
MYRPFILCDDSKGVVECGAIRKCKSGSQKIKQKIESRTKQKNSTSSNKAEKERMIARRTAEGPCNASSFQLLGVSRGTQKLNQVIESWSRGLSYDGKPKDITEDMLKGALDLQESLIMLGKLQEASKYMVQSKKKQKEKLEKGSSDEMERGRISSFRSGDQICEMALQKPRLWADGSSRDCVGELGEANRDSLARKSLPSRTTKEVIEFGSRELSSNSDAPSTSSSNLSEVQSKDSQSTDSTLQRDSQKKIKGPNLIAKMMGLEDIPAMPTEPVSRKQLGGDQYLSWKWPVFATEMPKARKRETMMQKTEHEKRTLKEMLEKKRLKGLLKCSSVDEFTSYSHRSSDSNSKQTLVNNSQPIVLIKPLHVSCLKSEEALPRTIGEKGVLTTDMMQGLVKVKESIASGSIKCQKSSLSCSNKSLTKEEGAKAEKPRERDVKLVDQKDEALNASTLDRKLVTEESLKKRLSQEVRSKDHKEVVNRTKEKEVETNLTSTFKTTHKKVSNIQKIVENNRKPLEREIVKSSQDQAKVTPTKLQTQNELPQQHRTTSKTISRRTAQAGNNKCKYQGTKERLPDEDRSAKVITENSGRKGDDMRNRVSLNDNSIPEGTKGMIVDNLPTEKEADVFKTQSKDDCSDKNVTLRNLQHEKEAMSESSKDDGDQINRNIRTDITSFRTRTSLKAFLLSSPLFLTLADESIHLNAGSLDLLPASHIRNFEPTDTKLYLNYAHEFVGHRTVPNSPIRHPLLPNNNAGNSGVSVSLDQLVDEICDGIETLSSYCTPDGNGLCSHSLFAMLEKDMSCKTVVTGAWNLGWNDEFSAEEAEEAVTHIEKLLLGDLIEEILA